MPHNTAVYAVGVAVQVFCDGNTYFQHGSRISDPRGLMMLHKVKQAQHTGNGGHITLISGAAYGFRSASLLKLQTVSGLPNK